MMEVLKSLPTDHWRRVLWRFSDRVDLQALVTSAREVARGPVARLVAKGGRSTNAWTPEKNELLAALDRSGITAVFVGQGAEVHGECSSNLARALIAFELAWVDAGAATSLLASLLACAPIHCHGTAEQKQRYSSVSAEPSGGHHTPWRGAFCLTEPIPYAGADASILGGKVRIAQWENGKEPTLRVEKRGRFITNMGFANFVVAAVESADARIRGSCLVILEEDDEGVYDRGIPTRKLAHQLSSTSDPRFDLQVPACRILGGYTVQDGVIVPNFSHGELIEPVLKRSRVTVGLLTSAKLLSAVEPLIRYHRERFRGSDHTLPGTPRFEWGLQQHRDVVHRVVEIWVSGEAGASLGFAAARLLDVLDPLECRANAILQDRGIAGRSKLRVLKQIARDARSSLDSGKTSLSHPGKPLSEDEFLLQHILAQTEVNVLAPAVKLWNTGVGTSMMREAVSLMGGYGIAEDCPGFLAYKWIDAQLEATYEGPEAVQRRSLAAAISVELFPILCNRWLQEMQACCSRRPGARTVLAGMELWWWTYNFLHGATDKSGACLYKSQHQGVMFPLVDALCWLLAARQLILDVDDLDKKSPSLQQDPNPQAPVHLYDDLCQVQSARASGEAARICAELVFGYVPESETDPISADACSGEMARFLDLRAKLDRCLTSSRLAKNRAAEALTAVAIPGVLDYPR